MTLGHPQRQARVRVTDGPDDGRLMAWLAPTIGCVFVLAAIGITSKLALRNLSWQELIPWAMIAYVVTVAVMLPTGQTRFTWGLGTAWAAAAGVAGAAALALLYPP